MAEEDKRKIGKKKWVVMAGGQRLKDKERHFAGVDWRGQPVSLSTNGRLSNSARAAAESELRDQGFSEERSGRARLRNRYRVRSDRGRGAGALARGAGHRGFADGFELLRDDHAIEGAVGYARVRKDSDGGARGRSGTSAGVGFGCGRCNHLSL